MALARYSFLPWLRRGIANQIAAPAATTSRASIDVQVNMSDGAAPDSVSKRFALYGPGDIIGVNPQMIIRTEPRAWVTDFEPNYLAFVEFYDEDFPWRYSPMPPDGRRLIPWLHLLVLAEGEFERNRSPGRPLMSVAVTAPDPARLFPPADQLWAWVHVQVSADLGDNAPPDAAALEATLAAHPDYGLTRLISPRRLEPNTAYTAFLIPTFEAGRKAGLGEAVDPLIPGIKVAWDGQTEFPIYHEWYFRTGAAGDFEELVRRIVPRPIDPRVGIRDMDVRRPGFGLPDIIEPAVPDHPAGTIGLEGALRSPTMQPHPHAATSNFPPEAARIVNLPADVQATGTVDDPLVTPPIYGRWHALVELVDPAPAHRNWINALNTDARFRAAAGLGNLTIQLNQEDYMRRAWDQIGEVLAANRKIHFLQFALQANVRGFAKNLAPLAPNRALAVTAPVFARVRGSRATILHLVAQSRLPLAAYSGALRKLLRPRGLMAKRALPLGERTGAVGRLAEAINDGRVSAAPPRPKPSGPTLEGVAGETAASGSVRGVNAISRLILILLLLLAILAFFMLPPVIALIAAGALVVAAVAVYRMAVAPSSQVAAALGIAGMTPQSVADASVPSSLALTRPGSDTPESGVTPDAAIAAEFRDAQIAFDTLLQTSPPELPPRPAADLGEAHAKVMTAINPTTSFPRRASHLITVGGMQLGAYLRAADVRRLADVPFERIVPVLAYPDIKDGMYKPLADRSDELLVPNLALVPSNTISIMLTNQPFIEAYMVGLNHEFARELLWREYPTDQRGSPFRQFWDVTGVIAENVDEKTRNERLKDIPPIHTWRSTSQLGDHDQRAINAGDRIVLVVRGDLLKRYPNTIIYAQQAQWGTGDRRNALILYDETGEKAQANVHDPGLRFPIFKAEVRPDLHFIGFDLALDTVRGAPDLAETEEARLHIPADRLGWFFVLQEVVGEPRFGLDETSGGTDLSNKWDNFAWSNLDLQRAVIDVAAPFRSEPPGANPTQLDWRSNASDIAAVLYQKPVLVGVHAREMLANLG
jgi:hypothetical protein